MVFLSLLKQTTFATDDHPLGDVAIVVVFFDTKRF